MIGLARARTIVSAFARQRILVVGDLMLDRYIYGGVERISPEAPVPVVRVMRTKDMAGGAANVAVNIQSLGGQAVLGGVIGKDSASAALRRVLAERRIRDDGVVALPGTLTTVKMRIVAERQQVVRVDWDGDATVPPSALASLCRKLQKLVDSATGVIIEDYGKGFIRQVVVDSVLAAAQRKRIPVGLDPKDNMDLKLAGIALATPNCREAFACAGLPLKASIAGDPLKDASLRRAEAILLRKWKPAQLIITLGPQGMYLAAPGKAPQVIPTRAREVFDVSGAGDTVIATCLLALAAGADGLEAVVLGNCAAGVVVGKLGTASCSAAELLAFMAHDEE
jgi:rfaE bifunctional protein kinase chain/domain